MTVRQTTIWIGVTAAATCCVGVAVLVAGFAISLNVEDGDFDLKAKLQLVSAGGATAKGVADELRHDLATLQSMCAIDLRKPLQDGTASSQAEGAPSLPAGTPMSVRLIGAIYEKGHSMAMFQRPDGSIEVCAVGERIADGQGEVVVASIDSQKVIVQFAGQSHELFIPPATGVTP